MRLFCPCSWKIYPWSSTEYWVSSLLPPCGRSNHPPVSIGAVESHLMNYYSFFRQWFFSIEILYLSLTFWRFTIVWLDTDTFLFTSLDWDLLGFLKLYNGGFINSGKLLAIISSNITPTPVFSLSLWNTSESRHAFPISLQVSYPLFHCLYGFVSRCCTVDNYHRLYNSKKTIERWWKEVMRSVE